MKNGDTAPYSISPVPTEFLSDFSRYFKVQSPRKDQSFFFSEEILEFSEFDV